MSFSWFVYTSLSPDEANAVGDRLRAAIAALVEKNPALAKKGGEWGDVTVGEAVPSADDVAELAEAYDRDVSEDVLDRLDACTSALEVERAGVNELDPLQVSALHWLLDNLEPFLVDWGDFQIVKSESVRGDLEDFPSAGALEGGSAPRPAAKREAEPEEDDAADDGEEPAADDLARAAEIADGLEKVMQDPFLSKRLNRALAKGPDYVKAYVARLQTDGPRSDAQAAKELGVALDVLQKEIDKLHDTVTELVEDADEA